MSTRLLDLRPRRHQVRVDCLSARAGPAGTCLAPPFPIDDDARRRFSAPGRKPWPIHRRRRSNHRNRNSRVRPSSNSIHSRVAVARRLMRSGRPSTATRRTRRQTRPRRTQGPERKTGLILERVRRSQWDDVNQAGGVLPTSCASTTVAPTRVRIRGCSRRSGATRDRPRFHAGPA